MIAQKFIIKWQVWLFILLSLLLSCSSYVIPQVNTNDLKNKLPGIIYFRTNQESYNDLYYFVLREEIIYYKLKTAIGGKDDEWKVLPIHSRMKTPVGLSADDENLLVLDNTGQLYTMLKGLSRDSKDFFWRRRWGFPFWFGKGIKLEKEYLKWDISFISPLVDQYYEVKNGNKHDLGIGCTTAFLLEKNGRKITFIDPWLVNDFSNAITTPERGQFQAVNMSASGSTVFIIDKSGKMYTLLFDFDIGGMDDMFFNYSYNEEDWVYNGNKKELVPRKIPRPLPIEGWQIQPEIEGKITDQITIIKQGTGARYRTLIVEGIKDNKTGYYTKDINATSWKFVETGAVLKGEILNREYKSSPFPPEDSYAYKGEILIGGQKYAAEIRDFNPYCFYSTLTLFVPEKKDFVLHHYGTIRLNLREQGLSNDPLPMTGAIEISGNEKIFGPGKFLEVKINAKATSLKITGKGIKGSF